MTEKKSNQFYKTWYQWSHKLGDKWTKEKIQVVAKEMEKANLFSQDDGGDEAFLYMILYSNGLLSTSNARKNYLIKKMK